jgi:hypothetical protein
MSNQVRSRVNRCALRCISALALTWSTAHATPLFELVETSDSAELQSLKINPILAQNNTDAITIAMSADIQFNVEIEERITNDKGFATYVGACENAPAGSFIVTVGNGTAVGRFIDPAGQTYAITPQPSGALLHTVNGAEHAGCAVNEPAPLPNLDLIPIDTAPTESVTSRFDVMVFFTPAALADAGSEGGMDVIVENLEVTTNEAFQNSNIDASIRIVHAAVTNYNEIGVSINTTLERLRETDDGFMDDVHPLRDDYGADMVALITTEDASGCGLASVLNHPMLQFAPFAFSVSRIDCAIGNLTFSHEIGHNMGCAHDAPNAGVTGAYPYSFGFQGAGFRTMMATAGGPRIPHYSNPNVLFQGSPTGSPIDGANPAHNAMSINQLRKTIASWRPETACLDFNLDGESSIDGADLAVLLASWGGPGAADFNGDGVINGADLALLLANWGACP